MRVAHLRVPSNTDFVGPVIEYFHRLFQHTGIEEAAVNNVVTSVIEAMGNAINHGNEADVRKKIQIGICVNQKTLKIAVQDEGAGFNAENLPDPLAPENILKPCGRGIFLIRSLMDTVSFDFSEGTTLMMEKTFEKALE